MSPNLSDEDSSSPIQHTLPGKGISFLTLEITLPSLATANVVLYNGLAARYGKENTEHAKSLHDLSRSCASEDRPVRGSRQQVAGRPG
jgi:hypothetical protein